jgi:branched-chain amino acid transport system ATP-binding protein
VIEVTDLVVRYGEATALDHVSLRVEAGEMVALVGPNGAGKSTLVNTLCGILRPAAGTVRVGGRLALVPEGRHLFPGLTVEDNLRLGAWGRRERDTSWVYELLPGLNRVRRRRAESLSGGEQQMVAVGRALMARPEVLVVDELSLGLAPKVVTELARHLTELNAGLDGERGAVPETGRGAGPAVLLIEQNARLAFDLCARAYVLEAGRIVTEGPCADLADDPTVARAYLGGPIEEPHE